MSTPVLNERSPLLAWGGLRVHAPVSLFLNDILKIFPRSCFTGSVLVFALTSLGDIEFHVIVIFISEVLFFTA